MKFSCFWILFICVSTKAYYAEVRPLNQPTAAPLFKIEFSETKNKNQVEITALFKSGDEIELIEKAIVNDDTAEFLSYSVDQRQTKEKGTVDVIGDKVNIKYESIGQSTQSKQISNSPRLVSPANFDRWLKKNFNQLAKNKTMTIDFLVWDRLQTYDFKVTYLGLHEIQGRKIQQFKMNIDNFLISAFISPIEIDMNENLTELVRFRGRVAVKLKKGNKFENLDAEVKYYY